jgi:plasmid stability protein
MEAHVQVSVRVPAEHVKALEQAAAEQDRTVSAELRRIIRQHVSQEPTDTDSQKLEEAA